MTRLALRNPIAVLMGGIACALVGFLAVRQLPVDLFPRVDVPVIMVGTLYPGASPEVVERTVSYQVERAVSQTANLDYVSSQSRYGLSIVRSWYRWGTNIDAAQLQVSQEVSSILKNLPKGIYPPFVVAFDVSNIPVANILMESTELDEKSLYELATNVIQPQLSSLPGISYASPTGGKVREIVVRLDPDRLRARGVDVGDVEKAVIDSNLLMSAGDMKIGTLNYNVFANSQVANLEELNRVVVKTSRGIPVHLSDVGAAVDGSAIQVNVARINGKRGMYLSVYRQPGTNAVEVVDALQEALPTLSGVPASVKMTVAFDQAKFVRASLSALQHEALQGALLAVLVIAFFLGNLRSTFIVFLSLPLSVLATFLGLQLTGETLNTFTLLGLTLVASRIIDNAIVVLENIHRHLKEGKAPLQAAYDGASEVALPVLASSLVTVIVFAPIVMVEGVARFLFTPMLVTMALGMAASYVVAITVVPVLCRKLLREHSEHSEAAHGGRAAALLAKAQRAVDAVEARYELLLRWALSRPGRVVAGTTLLFLASLTLVPLLGTEFFPSTDESQFRIVLRGSIGTRLEETERELERMEGLVKEAIPAGHLKTILGNAGTPRGSRSAFYSTNTGPHSAYLQVELVPPGQRDVSSDEYVSRLRTLLQKAMPGRTLSFDPGGVMKKVLNFGFSAPISVEISGYDLAQARDTGRAVAAAITEVDGIKDVLISREENFPQLNVTVDREKAALAGLSQRDTAQALLGSLLGNYSSAPYFQDPKTGNQYPIVTRVQPASLSRLEDLGNLSVVNAGGAPVYLKAVADISRGSGPVQIDRRRLERVVEVTANPAGRDLGAVSADVRAAVDKLKLPPGFRIRLRGQTEIQERTFASLGSATLLALALVYMLLASQFRSLLQPLVMMTSVPLGLIGVFAALALTGTTLSTTSAMGIIMMVGVAVSNGVLMLDYANVLKRGGATAEEAIIRAGRARLRPILMTSLATLLGLLPMALGLGEGSETNAPLARAVVGGLSVSTALTLLFVPVLYNWVEKRFGKPANVKEEEALQELGATS
ncbi:MAG: efflux RND transporter permease subunit [Myxococcaceae bacterium]